MFQVSRFDGRGRTASWQPQEGVAIDTPNLIVPEVPQVPLPEWCQVTLTGEPNGRHGVLELQSGGTWFHPAGGATGDWVVPAPEPAPTTEVQVLEVGEDLAVWHDAGGWASDPRKTADALPIAADKATRGRLLWAPALGTPADYAVWAYLGVDLFDASPLFLAASRGVALTVDGPVVRAAWNRDYNNYNHYNDDVAGLAAFNLDQARQELARVRAAIEAGSLRALAERRAYADPDTVALLRRFDQEHHYLEATTPMHRQERLDCMTWESLWSPEVRRFRRRMRESYRPPAGADVLVLLPCSAGKPYKISKSHRYFARALDESGIRHRCHEVMVTSPLGLVPRELEELYPAGHYDVPVTGTWNADEQQLIRIQLQALLQLGGYQHVIVHTGQGSYDVIHDIVPDAAATVPDGVAPQSQDGCRALTDALRGLPGAKTDPRSGGMTRKHADLQSLARFQFGTDAGEALGHGGSAKGRPPFRKLFDPDGEQLGMTTRDRGLLHLTLAGAARLLPHSRHRVYIEDFHIRKTSTLWAVGVLDADPDIRAGDEVLVVHRDADGRLDLRGVGVAQMSASDMTGTRRGSAVTVRHSVPAPEKNKSPAAEKAVTA